MRFTFALISLVFLASCMGSSEALPVGHGSISFAHDKNADCTIEGPEVKNVKKNRNFMGQGFTAHGNLRSSTIVCTLANGDTLITADHRELFARGSRVVSAWNTISLGQVNFAGEVTIGTALYNFSNELVWSKR